MDSHYVVKRPLHTEKSVEDIRTSNCYHFEVHEDATKGQIREAIEELFPGTRVQDVRTMWVKGKQRRMGWVRGKTPDWKKAVVRLRPGDTVDIGY